MPVVYPLSLPTLRVTQYMIGIDRKIAATESAFTGQQQILEWPLGALWTLQMSGFVVTRREEMALHAFLDALHDQIGTVLAGPKRCPRPVGTADIVSVTATGAALSSSLSLAGLGANKTLAAGDMIQLGSGLSARLHRIVNPVTASGTGTATVDVEPYLKTSYSSAPVVLANPRGLFRLASAAQPPQVTAAGVQFSLSFREAL
jgi:hypothetical protein